MIRECNSVIVVVLASWAAIAAAQEGGQETGPANPPAVAQPAERPASKVDASPVAKPANKPMDEPAARPEDKPVVKPMDSAVKKQTPRRLTDIEALLGRPADTELLWRQVERDLEYGLADEAQRHLTLLMARPDLDDRKILELREKYGTGLLVRAQRHPELAKLAQPLFDRLTKAAVEQARDPKRIQYFLGKLDDSRSEQGYAIVQLGHAGPYAIPFFIDALRNKRMDEASLIEGLMSMPSTAWPAAAAAIDSRDVGLISLMLDFLRKISVPESADFVWFVAGNPNYPQELRVRARSLLAYLTGLPLDGLPTPVQGLVAVAERFDRHRSGLGEPAAIVTVWHWDGRNVASRDLPVWKAEEHYGLRAAKLALELNPDDSAAKVVLMNLALEGTFERVGVDAQLPPAPLGAWELSLSAGPALLLDVLDQANKSRRTAVALGAVHSLAETASPNIISGDPDRPTPLIAALDFPNARVRLAAALAALNIHSEKSFPQADRVVTNLAHALDPSNRPGALVLDSERSRGNATAKLLADLGYDPVVAIRGRDGFRLATETRNIEVVVVDPSIRDGDLLTTLEAFSNDPRASGVPTFVISREPMSDSTRTRIREYANVAVLPPIDDGKRFGEAMNLALPDRALVPWSQEERRANRIEALKWLGRIARGELAYLDAMPAVVPLAKLLPDREAGPLAADALAFVPSHYAQQQLAGVVLDSSLDASVRAASARALAKNLQRHANGLDAKTIASLVSVYRQTEDASLRTAMAAVVGCVDKNGKAAGERLRGYLPSESGEAEPKVPMDSPSKNAPAGTPPPPKANLPTTPSE